MNHAHHSFGWRLGISLLLATPLSSQADTAALEIAEFGFVGPAALAVETASFPVHAGNHVHQIEISVPAGAASVPFANALSSRLRLATPSLQFTRTPPQPFHTITFFDATVRSINSVLAASPPGALLRETASLEFSRYERTHSPGPGISNSVYFNCPDLTLTHTTNGGAPPAVVPIPPQSVPAGSSFDIPLTLDDPDSPFASLVLSSTHPTSPLLPPGSITFSPPGPSAQASITLPPGLSGSVFVTIIADDGANQGFASFQLTVTPGNSNAPTDITLSNHTIDENTPDGQSIASISVVDPNPLDTHTLTLDDNAGGRFDLLGNELVVANTSLIDFETTNLHQITITAVDNFGNAYAKSFEIKITDVPEGAFDRWRADHFDAAQLADPLISGLFADPDQNGFPNLAEFNGNSNPLDPTSSPPPLILGETLHEEKTHPTLSWLQRTAASDPQMETHPQFSTNAVLWVEDTLAFIVIDTVPNGSDHEQVTARLINPRSTATKGFFRLRLRRQDP